MNAYTTYNIQITGSDEEVNKICSYLKEKITDVEYEVGRGIHISETHDCVFEEEVIELAKGLARIAGGCEFVMDGYIDTSELGGLLKDFEIVFKNGVLTSRFSDWFIDTCMDSYSSYEDFRDSFFECTEDEYNAVKDSNFVYILETDDGETLCDHVPFGEAETIVY